MAKIVVADDDSDLSEVYSIALRTSGHEVLTARDGEEAIRMVRQHRPSVLLLDVWMPTMTGFDVLEALRHDSAGSRLKIVMISNLSDADSRLEAFEAGATAYLVKGRSLGEMLALVGSTLQEDLNLTALVSPSELPPHR